MLALVVCCGVQPKVAKEKLTFGAVTSDHMLEVDWTAKDGWAAPVISPYHPLAIDPAASVLHYGLEVRTLRVRVRVCACACARARVGRLCVHSVVMGRHGLCVGCARIYA
ncbi:hypothetical protein EON67_09815, partial [archaeon]